MKLRLFNVDFVIEYSFFLLLSFALLFGAKDISYLLLFSSLHESGHIIALLCLGGKIDKLTLSFYGLALRYSSALSSIRELMVIICGPLVNFILYIIIRDDINLLLFILNILPIYPLDGGRILRICLPKLSKPISIIALVAVIAFSLYLIIFYHSFSLILISLYLLAYSLFF